MHLKILSFLLSCLFTYPALSQVIDYSSTFKSSSNKYIRLHYDNDYFTKTDDYYTQGITLELAAPGLRKSPLNKILLRSGSSDYKYGIALAHFGYTATTIKSDAILYGDRPFAANLTVSSYLTSIDTVRRRLITAAVTVGVIGPAAKGKEMQETIHRWLDYIQPHGWQYQIQNDLILTYQINYEKELVNCSNWFLLNTSAEIKAGTHTDRIKAGFNFMAGNFSDPYQSRRGSQKKVSYYLYGQVQPGFTIYDATLQGGLFNRNSPYTISASALNRFTAQADYGVVLSFRSMYLEYCQSILTKEFQTGRSHRWGGVRIGVNL